jgi:two-component system phosphate regulon sensor histidine kinase PhoR
MEASTRITVILPDGRVVGDSLEEPGGMDNHIDRSEVLDALNMGLGTSIRYSRTLDRELMYAAVPVQGGGRPLAVIRTAIPLEGIDRVLQDFQFKIVIAGLVVAVFATLVGLWASHRITRPIEQIREWADSIARGSFQLRPSITASAELEALSESMNQMAAQLRERIDTIMQQRNEIEAVLSSMVEGVIAVDTNERVISMNQAAGEMFGCNPSVVGGRGIEEVFRNTELQRFIRQSLRSHSPLEKVIEIYFNGERYVNSHGTALRDAEGKQIGASIVLNDITRLRRLEKIRSEFVANVSHELRTPITTIKGFVETLRDGGVENADDVNRFLGIVSKHVDRLNAIIEDLLSLSRIEQQTEKKGIVLTEGRIRDVLESAIQACEVKAHAKNIQMELVCEGEITGNINEALLEQAVVNLLDNAIKYSEAGSVVRVKAAGTDGEISIQVMDEGTGIKREHLPRLFERFYRADPGRSRDLGGTGLGLAIVKHVVQAHGGRVTVDSTFGEGSTFTIYLSRA